MGGGAKDVGCTVPTCDYILSSTFKCTDIWIEKEGEIHALLLRKANVSYYQGRAILLSCP